MTVGCDTGRTECGPKEEPCSVVPSHYHINSIAPVLTITLWASTSSREDFDG